jgi:hypothetical protein
MPIRRCKRLLAPSSTPLSGPAFMGALLRNPKRQFFRCAPAAGRDDGRL